MLCFILLQFQSISLPLSLVSLPSASFSAPLLFSHGRVCVHTRKCVRRSRETHILITNSRSYGLLPRLVVTPNPIFQPEWRVDEFESSMIHASGERLARRRILHRSRRRRRRCLGNISQWWIFRCTNVLSPWQKFYETKSKHFLHLEWWMVTHDNYVMKRQPNSVVFWDSFKG